MLVREGLSLNSQDVYLVFGKIILTQQFWLSLVHASGSSLVFFVIIKDLFFINFRKIRNLEAGISAC